MTMSSDIEMQPLNPKSGMKGRRIDIQDGFRISALLLQLIAIPIIIILMPFPMALFVCLIISYTVTVLSCSLLPCIRPPRRYCERIESDDELPANV